jgi:hypothetical protein
MTGDLTFDASASERKVVIDAGAGNGKFEIAYDGTNPTKKVRFTTDFGTPRDFIVVDPLTLITSFEQQNVFNGDTTFNNNVVIDNANLTMLTGGDLLLDHDPVLALEASTKQYVDNSVLGVSVAGQLLSIDKLNYTSYYDINTSATTNIPGFQLVINVLQAPVTFTANSVLHVYLKGIAGGHAAYFDVTVIGGEYVTQTPIAKVAPEGSGLSNIVIPSTMIGSGILAQNTTYTFTVRGRNSSLLPNQDTRLNTTDSVGGAVADPFVQSTLEITTFSQ